MSAYTDPSRRTGLALYAKPHPHTAFNSGDEIEPASSAYGSYYFTVDPLKEYGIYLQAGGDPASSDQWQGTIPRELAVSEKSVSVVTRTTYEAEWNSFFDIRGLIADIDMMDPNYSFSDTSATTLAVTDGPARAIRDRVNGWRFYTDGSSYPTRKSDHLLFANGSQQRLIASDTAALAIARNRARLYAFALCAPTTGIAQDVMYVSTNGTQAWRARLYTNSSNRLLAATYVGDSGSSQGALTDTNKVAGSAMVVTGQFLYSAGSVKVSKNLDVPSTGVLSPAQNSADAQSVIFSIGGSGVLLHGNVVTGPIYRIWIAAPSTAYTDDELEEIITQLAALKSVTL